MLKGQLAQQPLLTGMHIALVALGTAAMILVSHLLSAVSENAQRDARDIDLVVGAKGSPVQLVLAGVYHADVPSGNVRLASVMALKKNPLVASVIPLSLGDSFAGARIVGTVPDFIAHYGGQFASGGPWVAPIDAVLGAEVAARTGLQVGETFVGAHGLDSAGGAAVGVTGGHDAHPMMVVGILKRTGATLDRLVVTSLESVWDAHGIQGSADNNETTLALVRYASPLAAATLPRQINSSSDLQAASPALESARLLTIFGWIGDLLRGFAGLVLAVAGMSVFVALSQLLAHRRYDVALVRALGASRAMVTRLLLLETLIVATCGALLGLMLARVALLGLRVWLPPQLVSGEASISAQEIIIVLTVIGFSVLCAVVPALRAYRVDAGSVLSQRR